MTGSEVREGLTGQQVLQGPVAGEMVEVVVEGLAGLGDVCAQQMTGGLRRIIWKFITAV